MRLSRFFQILGFTTVLAVVYIHMQMQIIDLAYQGNKKEQSIQKLIEENGNANYTILMLKSANNLGATMLDDNSDMQFSDSDDIVRIAASEIRPEEKPLGADTVIAKRSNSLMSLLSFGNLAEARTAK